MVSVCCLSSVFSMIHPLPPPHQKRAINKTHKHELCQHSKAPAEQQLKADKGLCNFLMVCPGSTIFLRVTLSLPKRLCPLILLEKSNIILYCCFWESQNTICGWNLHHKRISTQGKNGKNDSNQDI